MADVNQLIKKARPPLSKVAPLTYSICWGYVGLNFMLAATFLLLYQRVNPIAVANILPYSWWGIVFLFLAVLNAVGLIRNSWEIARNTQLISVTVKTIWTVALVIQAIHTPQSLGVVAIWIFLAYFQALTYIHFLPPLSHYDDTRRN